MGNGVSIQSEITKPVDCSDLKSDCDARAEVYRLRKLMRDNQQLIISANTGGRLTSINTNVPPSSANKGISSKGTPTSIKSPTNVDFSRFDRDGNKDFKLANAPSLYDYIVNEFHRFCGQDEVLDWQEFWRFLHGLDLGLTDFEIGQLRQKADANSDGVVEWDELLSVIEPLLGKIWNAKLNDAPEYNKWKELHWETHHKVKKTKDGYTQKGEPFWVNKITGETSWIKPKVLERHPSIEIKRNNRNSMVAPNLTQFLTEAFEKNSVNGKPLSYAQLWKIVKTDLHVNPPLSPKEMETLMASADFSGDGKLDLQEFLHALSPKFETMFGQREEGSDWMTLSHVHTDGHEYLYWYVLTLH